MINTTFDNHMGIHDMQIDTGEAPEFVSKKMNAHVANGGGGGGTSTSSNIDPEFKPYLLEAGKRVLGDLRTGQYGHVQRLTPEQVEGLERIKGAAPAQEEAYAKGAAGRDVLGAAAAGETVVAYETPATRAIKDKAIRESRRAFSPLGDRIATVGATGGARERIIRGERDAALAASLADIDYRDLQRREQQALGAAEGVIRSTAPLQAAAAQPGRTVSEAGVPLQEQGQRIGDRPYQESSRGISLLSGVPVPTQSTVSKGGK